MECCFFVARVASFALLLNWFFAAHTDDEKASIRQVNSLRRNCIVYVRYGTSRTRTRMARAHPHTPICLLNAYHVGYCQPK